MYIYIYTTYSIHIYFKHVVKRIDPHQQRCFSLMPALKVPADLSAKVSSNSRRQNDSSRIPGPWAETKIMGKRMGHPIRKHRGNVGNKARKINILGMIVP